MLRNCKTNAIFETKIYRNIAKSTIFVVATNPNLYKKKCKKVFDLNKRRTKNQSHLKHASQRFCVVVVAITRHQSLTKLYFLKCTYKKKISN